MSTGSRTPAGENEELRALRAEKGRFQGYLSLLDRLGRRIAPASDLSAVLQEVADAACELTGARYGALAVFDASGRIQEFITHGITPEERDRIGNPPQGLGLLGWLHRAQEPLRLADLTQHSSSLGFPPNHPPMKTFLGAPIRYGGEVLAVVYLAEKAGGAEFNSGDEEVLTLSATQIAALLRSARDLTQRKEAEEAATRSRALIAKILQAALDAILITDDQGKVIEFNRAAEEMFGYSRAEALGREVFDLIVPPSLRERNREGLADAVGRGEGGVTSRRVEGTAMRADGTEFPVEVTSVPLPTEGRLMFAGFIRDITERKRLEEELRRNEEYFRSLTQNASDLVAILESDGTIRYCSPSHERVLGYKPEELESRNVFELLHPDDAPSVIDAFTQALKSPGLTPPIEFRFRHKDGSWPVLEAIGNSRLDDPAVAGVIVNTRDITERKRMEEALRASEERYRLLTEHARDAIFRRRLGPAPGYDHMSRAIMGLTGYTPEEFYAVPDLSMKTTHPADRPL
ncbi:MAG TPA: PAS domain S-box protein, partial [Dehalococcoidia bacterium]|nr:PAS domain S-box protein [Dehalococcoidia bacterium]